MPGVKKKPSTSELAGLACCCSPRISAPSILRERDPRKPIPLLHGALLKNEQDVSLFEKLAFMQEKEGGERPAPRG